MGNRFLNLLLALALVASLAMILVRRTDPTQPNYEFLPNMVHSVAYEALSPNPNFPDGKTLQAPLPGTIPRGYPPLPYQPSQADAVRAGLEMTNPFKVQNRRVVERGAFVFTNFCVVCHGASGKGDGPVAQHGYPPPPSLLEDHARNLKDGQIFHILSFGQGNMAPYASALAREDRWKVILYIRSLQAEEAAKAAATSAAPPAATPLPAETAPQ